jgi:Ser/Thr protein kinase RdoA (MazF antagonist)
MDATQNTNAISDPIDLAALTRWIERQYATTQVVLRPLALGEKLIFQVQHAGGVDWVARLYQRTPWPGNGALIVRLSAVLHFLEWHQYPAERIIVTADGATSIRYTDWLVLMTTYMGRPLRAWQPAVVSATSAGEREHTATPAIFFAIGAALGRLHSLPPVGVRDPYPAGMLPQRELTWAATQLAEVADRVPPTRQALYDEWVTAVQNVQGWDDLPQSLIHNDPNLGNVVRTEAGEIALVDWDFAGIGPTVLDVGILLRNCYSRTDGTIDEAAVRAVVDGYRQHRQLTPAELDRLPDAVRFMTLVLLAVSFPDLVDGTLGEQDLLYGATYTTWQAHYAASDQIAALARRQFEGEAQ